MSEIRLLGGLLKRINNFDITDFEGRLIFQKTIYLLQASGLYLDYKFPWYINGPHSNDLGKDGIEINKTYNNIQPISFLNIYAEECFKDFLSFLETKKDDAYQLEAMASVHFLNNLYKTDKESTIKMVLKRQKHLNKSTCGDAWNYLEDYKRLNHSGENLSCLEMIINIKRTQDKTNPNTYLDNKELDSETKWLSLTKHDINKKSSVISYTDKDVFANQENRIWPT